MAVILMLSTTQNGPTNSASLLTPYSLETENLGITLTAPPDVRTIQGCLHSSVKKTVVTSTFK